MNNKHNKGTLFYRFVIFIFTIICNFIFDLKVLGIENLPKKLKKKGIIIAVNHISNLDFLIISKALAKRKYYLAVFSKISLFKTPFIRYIFRKTKQIPVYRNTKMAKKSLDIARKYLKQGRVIVIFPEGTLTKNKDKMPQKFKTGAVRLAKKTQTPIIPLSYFETVNTVNNLTKSSFMSSFMSPFANLSKRKIIVKIGKPINISKFSSINNKTKQLRKQIVQMINEIKNMK